MKIEVFELGVIATNCYIVTDEKSGESLIVDPGGTSAQFEKEISGKNIKYILLTHGHYDHILGVAKLKKLTGARVAISEMDSQCLYDDEKSRAGIHFPQKQEPVKADILLKDGDELALGEHKIKVLSTPGHTPGGVCYIIEDEAVVFSGDTLFKRTIGRVDLPGGDLTEMMLSLKRIAKLDGDFTIYPGHGSSSTLNYERSRNPYLSAH